MAETAVRALLARWEEGVTNLYAANEEEAVQLTRVGRNIKAQTYQTCIDELREALSAPPSPVSAATGETTTEEERG